MGRRIDSLRQELTSEPRRWLVTGVAGFIGSHLLETLLELDQSVVGLDNFATGKPKNIQDVLDKVGPVRAKRFRFVMGDIRDASVCQAALRNMNFVLHQAALASVPRSLADPQATHATNVDGFLNVLLGALSAGVQRVVYASSSSVYGDDDAPEKTETRIGRPLSPYAASKLCDEIYAGTYLRAYGLESIGLRYFNVFGPRQDPDGPYAAVIPRWIRLSIAGEPCVLYGDPAKSRDFCYVANVVHANLLAATAPAGELPAVVNVGAGRRTTLAELHDAIQSRVVALWPRSAGVEILHEAARAGDIEHSLASIGLAKATLGYEPEYDIGRGLDETLSWYASTFGRLCDGSSVAG